MVISEQYFVSGGQKGSPCEVGDFVPPKPRPEALSPAAGSCNGSPYVQLGGKMFLWRPGLLPEERLHASQVHILVNISLKLAQAWTMDDTEPALRQISLWISEEFGKIWKKPTPLVTIKVSRCGEQLAVAEMSDAWVGDVGPARGESAGWGALTLCEHFWRDWNNVVAFHSRPMWLHLN